MSNTRAGAQRQDLRRPKIPVVQQERQLQDAKARFSEGFRLARERGPQRVTKHGREAVVVITAEEYARLAHSEARRLACGDRFASRADARDQKRYRCQGNRSSYLQSLAITRTPHIKELFIPDPA